MSPENKLVSDLYRQSYMLSRCLLEEYCIGTQRENLWVAETDDSAFINACNVPVSILTLGNPKDKQDAAYMGHARHHAVMARAIANGIDAYFKEQDKNSGAYHEEKAVRDEPLVGEGTLGSPSTSSLWSY